MKLVHGEIIPEVRIGEFCLGNSIEEIKGKIVGEYTICDKNSGMAEFAVRFDMENFSLWFVNGLLQQIGVYEGFEDKYGGRIGIGNTLPDIHREYGETDKGYDTWGIKGIGGISFELADNDDDEEWDELKAPICAIYVYKNIPVDGTGD